MELHEILVTAQLQQRKSRPINVFAEKRALQTIARRMSYGRAALLDSLCEIAIELCRADSGGISVLDPANDEGDFHLDVVAGKVKSYFGDKLIPRHDSPCGIALKLGSPQLFSHPERFFRWMPQSPFQIFELLVIPLYAAGKKPNATIWVMANHEHRRFDQEDLRIMTALGLHASSAIQIQTAVRS
jgi:GAF domain-containing protein